MLARKVLSKCTGLVTSNKRCRLGFVSGIHLAALFSSNASDGGPFASASSEPAKPLHRQSRNFSSGAASPPRQPNPSAPAAPGTDYLSLFQPTSGNARTGIGTFTPGNILKVGPLPRYVLKEDIIHHVDICSLQSEKIKIVYNPVFRPEYVQFEVDSAATQRQITKRLQERGRLGCKFLKAEVSAPMHWTVVDAALKDSPRGRTMRSNGFAVLRNQYPSEKTFPERGVRHYHGGGRGRGRTLHDFDREYGQPGESKGSGVEIKDELAGLGREAGDYRKMDFEQPDAEKPETPEERIAYMRNREREIMLRKFNTQVIDVNRTFKVTKGGGEISFTALVICGNGDGLAGWGKGKGPKATRAIREASAKALNNLHYFERFKDQSIYHYVEAKYEKTKVRLWPEWTLGKFRAAGIVKGILRMAGISSVKSKLVGSSNPHNTVKATFLALSKIKTPKEYEEKYWRAVVERHLILDDEGKPHPEYRKISSYVL